MSYRVRALKLASGRCPFNEWLANLDHRVAARIEARIARLELGLLGDGKRLRGAEIYETRFSFGPGYRLYFGLLKGDSVLLILLGGDKSSQRRDVQEAKRLWQSYLKECYGQNK